MARKKLGKESQLEPVVHILIIVLIAVLIINFFLISTLSTTVKQKIKDVQEASKPAELQITIIKAECEDCFDISQVLELIKKGNVNITKEETLNMQKAGELIQKYNIKKLPTVIVTGQTNKTDLSFLTNTNEVYILTSVPLPYYSLEEKRVAGIIEATIINATDCEKCFNTNNLIEELKSNGITIKKTNYLKESEAGELIKKYNLKALPALILSKGAADYEILKENWQTYGTVADDKSYLSSGQFPPYKDLTTNSVKGLVTVTYITDKTCKECYDVKTHKKIIEGFGVIIEKEETYDISEDKGKELLNKYNTTLVPTVIISEDGDEYKSFRRAFEKVSYQTIDKQRIFNQPSIVGAYKDLKTNKVITPKQEGE